MASRSVLGCQHPCLLAVLGLALALLCGIPCVEAKSALSFDQYRQALEIPHGREMAQAMHQAVLYLAPPEFKECHDSPESRIGRDQLKTDLSRRVKKDQVWAERDPEGFREKRSAEYSGPGIKFLLNADPQTVIDGVQLIAENLSMQNCTFVLSKEDMPIVAWLDDHPLASPNEVRQVTADWVDNDPSGQRENKVEDVITSMWELRQRYNIVPSGSGGASTGETFAPTPWDR